MKIFSQASGDGIIVPVIWPVEVSNAMTTAVRRRIISRSDAAAAIDDLLEYPIFVSQTTLEYGLALMRIAHDHGLTSYDASYLHLAMLRQLPLATLDKPLRKAAQAAGVRVLPEV